MEINNCMLLMFKTFVIIGSVSAQTFNNNNNNNVTGPMTTSFITTTTLASILSNNYSSYPTPFIPSVSPISFQHTDAMLSGSHAFQHHVSPPKLSNDMIFFGNEVKSLSELPLETLLKIRKHLEEMTSGLSQPETAANVVYPVYEQQHSAPQGALSPGYLNLGGGTFTGGYENEEIADGSAITHGHSLNSGEVVQFYDHSKTYEHGLNGHGYITPQPFIHKFKKKHEAESWAHEKPSKIQTIFQVSVTALSFLAFGGYLLCMILAALKAKGTAYYPAKGQLVANQLNNINNNKRPVQNSPVVRPNKNRRPSYGRRRRKRSTKNNDNDKGRTIINGIYHEDFMEDGNLPFNHDQMFHALISIAEGYVKFNDFYHK